MYMYEIYEMRYMMMMGGNPPRQWKVKIPWGLGVCHRSPPPPVLFLPGREHASQAWEQ